MNAHTDTGFSYSQVIKNQQLDVHPPFYYLILNTVCSIFTDSHSIYIGIIINIVFFLIAQSLLFAIGKRILHSSFAEFVPILAYGFSLAAVNSVLFIRMYMLQVTEVLLLLYFIIRVLDNDSKACHVGILASIMLGMLTHYYFIIIAFFICITACVLFLIRKQIKNIVLLVISSFSGLFLAFILFPAMIYHIFYGFRGTESLDRFTSDF